MLIGVISDTHGLLRPDALAALQGVDHILHAGDIGDPAILARLREVAPLTAIRGNIDVRGECALLPSIDFVELDGHLFYMVHSLADLDMNPVTAQVSAIVSGHSHKAAIDWLDGVLYLNPGSAGPRRFQLPISVAFIEVRSASLEPHLVFL